MSKPIFANIRKSDNKVHCVNLCAIVEMVPDWTAGTTALYSAGNCMWNGHSFDIAPAEITAAIANPEFDGNGIVDLLPPDPKEDETADA
ncbi:MAG: hypothetical protein NXH70_02225 [Hyphomonas sp.]|nr:hypothetical protein [Hyphomonas sp.]